MGKERNTCQEEGPFHWQKRTWPCTDDKPLKMQKHFTSTGNEDREMAPLWYVPRADNWKILLNCFTSQVHSRLQRVWIKGNLRERNGKGVKGTISFSLNFPWTERTINDSCPPTHPLSQLFFFLYYSFMERERTPMLHVRSVGRKASLFLFACIYSLL